jgi:hypothetical protein
MNTSQGPTFPAEGMIDARPFWSVATSACEEPSRTESVPPWRKESPPDGPPCPGLTRASVVLNVTVTPMTGFAVAVPSVTRMTSGRNDCPVVTACDGPLTVSNVQR